GLEPWQAANLREMKRAWLRETSIPRDLVEAASRAESHSEQAWRVLRAANDWRSFRPLLETVVSLKRETAQALSERLGLSPYDALLDGYEPGARTAAIAPLFDELRAALPPLIERILDKQRGEAVIVPPGPFPVEQQRWLGMDLMRRVGFDWTRGRLDVSHHPFCGGVPTDVRITTRYDETDFQTALMGVMHETGHAKYEQNLPQAFLDQPVGSARGMSLHESQSLLQEMQICRSREFIELLAPLPEQAVPQAVAREPQAFTPENLFRVARTAGVHAGKPVSIRDAREEGFHSRRRRRSHVSVPRALALRDRERAHRGQAARRRHPRGVGRENAGASRALDARQRSRRVHAGRPLGGGALRLFPDVHARGAHRGAALPRSRASAARRAGRRSTRRVRRHQRMASRARLERGLPLGHARARAARYGQRARNRSVLRPSLAALSRVADSCVALP